MWPVSSNINNGSVSNFNIRNAANTDLAQMYNSTPEGNILCRVYVSGSLVYDYTSDVSLWGKKLKITNISGVIKFWYWGGASWTEIDSATGKNYDLGAGLFVAIGQNKTNAAHSGTRVFDNFYLSNADYSTENPT
jgi:hypothetical protein